jgi:Adenylate and Guanylate cyclase catalytic domain/MAP3K TRAFs-binding domain
MEQDDSEMPAASVQDWRRRGERLLASGAPIAAYDVLADGLAAYPGDTRLRQLLALALARSGATAAAIDLLEQLHGEGDQGEETLGLLASAHKDLWSRADAPDERRRHLESAHSYYTEAHRHSGGAWSGINAATTALLLGRRADAEAIARNVRAQCLSAEGADPLRGSDYWHLATIAEATLILRDWPAAEAAYARAIATGGARPADVASTRRNARLIIEAIGADRGAFERLLSVGRVVAFAGHLIDAPGRATPRFPPALEAAAAGAIRERLARLDVGFGYASAACGADILFLEAVRDRRGETTVVLPYSAPEFERDSVDIVPGAGWSGRFRRELEAARDVVTASEHRIAAGDVSYEYGALLIEGLAGVRADELDSELVRLVLWDGRSGGGRGGTASTIDRWGKDHHVEVIDLAAIARDASRAPDVASPAAELAAPAAPVDPFEPEIVALLFADARGFSGLREDQIPAFVDGFLGTVARTLARVSGAPRLRNTWGDGLYFVFDHVRDAGIFALELADAVAREDWASHGLPRDLALRTGLHAGPAYTCVDPVTGRRNYFGTHVSRAARIEPITPVGEVYASAAFAALARADEVREFRCEYVGRTPLAKHYGTLPMYVVRRQVASSSRGHVG